MHLFKRHLNEGLIGQEFDRFIERTKGKIEAWSERGSEWVLGRIMTAHVNVARYWPLLKKPINFAYFS